MTEGMLPPPKKSEELEFMESFIERALKAGLTDQECSKALVLARYWDTLEPAAEKLRKAASAGLTVIQATRNLMPALRSLLTEPTDLQDVSPVAKAMNEALLVYEKQLDEAQACLST